MASFVLLLTVAPLYPLCSGTGGTGNEYFILGKYTGRIYTNLPVNYELTPVRLETRSPL